MNTCSHKQIIRVLEDPTRERVSELFKAMGDLTRIGILCLLSNGDQKVCELAEDLGMTPSAISHQLRLLRNLRIVQSRRDGRHIIYSLDDGHIGALLHIALIHVEEPTK